MGTLYLPDTLLISANPSVAVRLDNQRFWHTRLIIPDWTSWSPPALTLNNCVISFEEGFHLDVTGDLTLENGAGLNVFATSTPSLYGVRLDVGGDLLIGSGSWLYPHAHGVAGSIVGLFIGGNVEIDADGGIDADGKGWFSTSGNTQGPGAGQGGNTQVVTAAGGGMPLAVQRMV